MPPKSKIGESCITHKECANNNCVNGKCTRKKKSGNKSKSKSNSKTKSKSLKHSSPIQPMAKKQESTDYIQLYKTKGITILEQLTIQDLENMLKNANDAYYNKTPLLTDNEFDIIKEFIQTKYPGNTVAEEIGAPIQGKNKVQLPFEMASMDKIKPDSGALPSWMESYRGPYVLSCKLDGVSGMYVCDANGKHSLYTRGNGLIGQDVSHLIKVLKLPIMDRGFAIRGEFIISKHIFQTHYSSTFANARNLVSGIINRKSADEKAKHLDFLTYEIIQPQMKPSDQMKVLEKMDSIKVVQNKIEPCVLTNETLSDTLVDWRENYEYEIDGVIVTNDEIVPRTSGNPKHAFAFKMLLSDQSAEAKVVDVVWEASKDGYLKPRVRIEPIQLVGVRIEYATGFNAKFIEDNKIGIGAVIMMVRSGDVIPYIKSVTTPAERAKMPDSPYIWNKTRVDIMLENPDEDETVQEKNIAMFFASLEVDGLKKGNIKKLFQNGKKTIPDILAMSVTDFENLEGFKKKMAEKVHSSIQEKVLKADLLGVMVASGKMGRGLGEKKLKPILKKYPDILKSQIPDLEKERLLKEIEGIGPENAREFVKNIPSFIDFLESCGLESKLTARALSKKSKSVENHELTNKKIVMSKIRDKEIIAFMEKHGILMEDSMKKDVVYLIVKSLDDVSSKIEYARKHNIPIVTADEFKTKYNL